MPSLLVTTLDMIEAGELEARAQPAEGISFAPKITTADAEVNWKLPAPAVSRLIRACTPAPGAWTMLDGARLKLGPVTPATAEAAPAPAPGPGELRVLRDQVLVGTGTQPVRLGDVQADGKRRMAAADWARGLRGPAGPAAVLG